MDYKKLSAPQIGIAGELRVRSELLLRGISAATYDFDSGADIVLDSGLRIQVKTCMNPQQDKKSYSWRYSFNIRQRQVRRGSDGKYTKEFVRRDYSDTVNFFVLWCMKDNLFYIIPEKEMGQKISIVISTPDKYRKYKKHSDKKSVSKWEKYKNAWDLLK